MNILIKITEIVNNAGIIQGFFLAFLLFNKKTFSDKVANRILATLLIVFSFSILHITFADLHFEKIFKNPLKVKEPFVLLIAPLLWLYVREISLKTARFSFKIGFHFLPFLAFFILMLPFLLHGEIFLHPILFTKIA